VSTICKKSNVKPPVLIFCSAILGTVCFSVVFLLVPDGPPSDKGGKTDWIGWYLGVGGLVLFNFVWK
jgi:hypothetical protein